MKIKHFNNILTFLFLTVFIPMTWAQSPSKKQVLVAAEQEFADKNYYGALIYFNEALEYDDQDAAVLFKSAESARLFNAYRIAAEKYQYLLDTLHDEQHPEALFWLGQMKQRMGKYEEAKVYYNLYLSEYSGKDSLMTERAHVEMKSLDYAERQLALAKKHVIVERMGDDINTPASEVSGNTYNDDFYYSSMNFKETNQEGRPARDISKLYRKHKEDSPLMIEGYLNERQELISNSTINPDGTVIYYTVCNYLNASDIRCNIYKSDLAKDGTLSNEMKLPDPINMEGYTSTQPFITKDKATGRDILYFVTDRPGGQGGLDIWYSLMDPKFGFSEPVNMVEINSPGHDITPFYDQNKEILYFSTDGRETIGGYDVFKSARINNSFGNPVSAGVPINSSYNDIYYYGEANGRIAYLSSNREGSLYVDAYFESCCYDIYRVNLNPLDLDLNALTFDSLTGRPLKNATVILLDKDTGLELGRISNDDGNEHIFPLEEDRNYIIIAERDKYYPDTLEFTTFGEEESRTIEKKMFLKTDMMLLDVFTFTKVGKLPLEGVTITLIDETDPSKQEVQVNPLSNDFYFMLDRGKTYRLIARKEGFTEDIAQIDTRPYLESGLLRQDMYLDKFMLPDLLPITLYFDNDLPDLRSKKTTTNAVYGDLVGEYMSKKEQYKEVYSKPLPDDQKSKVTSAYETFFEGDVRGGYDKFKLFLERLRQELEAGNKVELVLKGYTSPRADARYNLTLGQRRVNSVKNDMMTYEGGVLAPYFKSGQLLLTDISFGKNLAPPDVPSDLNDERNSIYNLKAALERRVEILRASRRADAKVNSKKSRK